MTHMTDNTKNITVLDNINMPGASGAGHIVICGDRIASIASGRYGFGAAGSAAHVIDCGGATALPGAIDIHVHFREPGLTHKATIASESRAAVAGGVTSFVDMPNVIPPTLDTQLLEDRAGIAARTSAANYGFWLGASADNADIIASADYSRIAGVKMFLGSSTGGLLVADDYSICRILEAVPHDVVVCVHAEDNAVIDRCRKRITDLYGPDPAVRFHSQIRPVEACVRATERILTLAQRYNTRLHVAHISTADELSLFSPGPIAGKRFTCEVSPHHLLWCDADYASRGTRIKMNPAVKSDADRWALRRGVLESRIDVIATDHAPHLPSEKKGGAMTAMSGAPMVQFSYPAMLDLFGAETACRLMAANPAALLGIRSRGSLSSGFFADIVLSRTLSPRPVTDSDVLSLCGWTPLAPEPGLPSEPFFLSHSVETVAINGIAKTPRRLVFNQR